MTRPSSVEAGLSRRELLAASMGAGLGIAGASLLAVAGGLEVQVELTPANEPLKAGDTLVFAQGARKGQPISPVEVPVGGPPVLAWPQDPASRVVRDQSPKNIVVMVRAGSDDWFSAPQHPYIADSVAAFSATCTHLCCTVSEWRKTPTPSDPHGYLLCPCHRSHYDPWQSARVLSGPAPRPLPILPLTTRTALLTAAQGFDGVVGCTTV